MEINIAGTTFKTYKSTLTDAKFFDTYEGHVIDRDPDSFKIILNFLRGITNTLPTDPYMVSLLKSDAEYYNIESLKQFLKEQDLPDNDKGMSVEEMHKDIRELLYELWMFKKNGRNVEEVDTLDVVECQDMEKVYKCLLALRTEYARLKAEDEAKNTSNLIKSGLELFIASTKIYHSLEPERVEEIIREELKDQWQEATSGYRRELFEWYKPQNHRERRTIDRGVSIVAHFGVVILQILHIVMVSYIIKTKNLCGEARLHKISDFIIPSDLEKSDE
jgi:hypothetical protein